MPPTFSQTEQMTQWLLQDDIRKQALEAVARLNLPQCYLAAGFLRNLVWDQLHSREESTPLNDVDVVYFAPEEAEERYMKYERTLKETLPNLNWQIRNQAYMHVRNGDQPYSSTVDAMGYLPEKETAVGVRLASDDSFEFTSAFGFESLFNLHITHNPKRCQTVFEQRVASKHWLKNWSKLSVIQKQKGQD